MNKIFESLKNLYIQSPNYLNLKLCINDLNDPYDMFIIDNMDSLSISINEITKWYEAGLEIVNGDGEVNELNRFSKCTFVIYSYTYNDADSEYRDYIIFIDKTHMSDIEFIKNLNLIISNDYTKFTNKSKRICIAGSLSEADKIKEVAKYYEDKGHIVYYAKKQPERSLFDIDLEFINIIDWCDIFVIVPKDDGSIGESVTYERAIAFYFDKEIIVWKNNEEKEN